MQSYNVGIENKFRTIKVNKKSTLWFKSIAVIFFFFNSFLLPNGFLYTSLMTPIFLIWLINQKVKIYKYLLVYFLIFSTYLFIHYFNGIYVSDYVVSSGLLFTCFVFCLVLYQFFKKYNFLLEPIIQLILKVDFILIIIAILLLPFKEATTLWNFFDYETGRSSFPRLQLFTPEPSAYGFLISPLALFYFQYFYYKNAGKKLFYIFVIIISLLLSFSFGAISGIMIAIGIFVFVNFFAGKRSGYNVPFLIFFLVFVGAILFIVFGPLQTTALGQRVSDILNGDDSSVNNRSWQAFILADQIVRLKSIYWGLGPGQVKIIGADLIHAMYGNGYNSVSRQEFVARIPSAMADTIVVFGYIGGVVRLLIEICLFIARKVYLSSFRFCLFLFVFVMQFVHSNVANQAEYLIWLLAFSNCFPDEYFKKLKGKPALPPPPAEPWLT